MFGAPQLGDPKAQHQDFTKIGRESLFLLTGGVTDFGAFKSTWPQNAKLVKKSTISPSPPQKRGSSGQCNICSSPAMQVVKKHFLLHANSAAIISYFRTQNFRRFSPYVFFEFLGAKKLELQIFLTSDKMAFCRACGPYHAAQQHLNSCVNKILARSQTSPEIVIFTKVPCLGPPSGWTMNPSTPILHGCIQGYQLY